jgi:hypothetical protein
MRQIGWPAGVSPRLCRAPIREDVHWVIVHPDQPLRECVRVCDVGTPVKAIERLAGRGTDEASPSDDIRGRVRHMMLRAFVQFHATTLL